MSESPKRRWLRFSLRTLFVVVTVLAAFSGWVVYHLNWIRERHQLLARHNATSAEQYVNRRARFGDPEPKPFLTIAPSSPSIGFGLRLFGETDVSHVRVFILDGGPEGDEIERAARLFPEATIKVYPGRSWSIGRKRQQSLRPTH